MYGMGTLSGDVGPPAFVADRVLRAGRPRLLPMNYPRRRAKLEFVQETVAPPRKIIEATLSYRLRLVGSNKNLATRESELWEGHGFKPLRFALRR